MRVRRITVAVALCALFIAAVICSPSAGAREGFPGPGFKSCGSFGKGARRLLLEVKHVPCNRAVKIQRAYQNGSHLYERRWNELCLEDFPGWCCSGGGGAVTCRRKSSLAVALTPSAA